MKNPLPLQVKINALSLYLFCTILVYLAGAYFGGILLFLFYAMLLLPLVSLGLFIAGIIGIKYFQSFSTDHPVKGETIRYSVKLANESPAVLSDVSSHFSQVNPQMTMMVPDFHCTVGARKSRDFTYTISCTYRGIYQVGLKSLLITDLTGFLTISLPVWHRTFYVYPRIITVNHLTYGNESYINKGSRSAAGGFPDHTLFNSIREYNRGDSLRYIYWKKFAGRGEPVIKEFDASASPGMTLYMDVFNEQAVNKSIRELEREDVSVEILTALVKYYLIRKISVSARCPCAPIFNFRGNSEEQFESYYKQTNNIFFGHYESPVALFKADLQNGLVESKSVIFITHHMDPPIFNLVEEALHSELQVMVIFNHTGSSPEEKERHRNFFYNLRDRGAVIIEVHAPDTIADDLERQTHV